MGSCSRIIGLVRKSVKLNSIARLSISKFRGFHTTNIMSEEQIEELKKNPYYAKYADKIAKLQNTSPEEFLSRLSAHEERKTAATSITKENQRDFSFPGRAVSSAGGGSGHTSKSLDKVLKLELLQDKTPEQIAEIWTTHFMNKENKICAVIPTETFNTMQQRWKEFNTFLFPVPRKNGYEFVMVQFISNEAHFTTLINYQAHKENAPECLNMIHYTEFSQDKGIVLMVGEYDKDTLDAREAKCLADQVEIYYSNPNQSRQEILEKFSKNPAYFDPNDLVKEFNSITIS